MLVLTRGIGQDILIDQGKVSIRVLSIKGGKVRIGVTAPEAVVVDRSEVHERRRALLPPPRALVGAGHG
jgi:carbon storage regulator